MVKEVPNQYEANEREEEIQVWWESEGIYDLVKKCHLKDPPWYFLDGPPYASGNIHLGTAWNKVIKDTVLRFQTMRGYNVRRQPGWDCHGLPIEVKVEEKIGVESKKDIERRFGIRKFIEECKKWATEHIDLMSEQFKRLGVWMDWDNPYLTFENDYLESAWWTLKKAHEKGLMEKRLQVIQWCPRCETALAEHEIRGEYRQVKDPSLYARFKLTYTSNEYLLIWTTTPWTIPANIAVTVNPDEYYAKVEVEGDTYIIAEALVSKVMNELGIYNYRMKDLVKGKRLEGLRYEHPLLKEVPKQNEFKQSHRIIVGDHVTLDEGTGCVHTAPGHGEEDFEIGKEYDLPVFSPVGEDGKFTSEAGDYQGIYVKDADEKILKDLSRKGSLMKKGIIQHSYPYCWRCKNPLIFRATDQWFLDVKDIKPQIVEQNSDKVHWVPDWAEKRFNDGVESVGDWCISRQRYWGIPIPIWSCENCGNREIIGDKGELSHKTGEDLDEIDLHRPDVDKLKIKCSDCGRDMKRVEDVLDVWFDSSIAPWATLGYPKEKDTLEKLWPSNFITEGEDQITKWFYGQQVVSMIAFEDLPYREALMHGFTLDKKGRKMSKSLGNVVEPSEIIEDYGADILRFYMLHTNPLWEDLKFSWEELEIPKRFQKVLWNSIVFASTYMSLDDFDPEEMSKKKFEKNLELEDRWILSRANRTLREITENIEARSFQKATRTIEKFVLEDLSRWYIKLIRWRTWIEEKDSKKIVAYETLYKIISLLSKVLSPFMPHLAEEIYQKMIRPSENQSPESVHMLSWPDIQDERIDIELEEDMEIVQKYVEAGAKARQKADIKGRWPVHRVIIMADNEDAKESAEKLKSILINQLNCKNLEPLTEEEFRDEIKMICGLDMKSIREQHGDLAPAIKDVVHNMNLEQIRSQVETQGFIGITARGEKLKIGLNDLSLDQLPEELIKAESTYGDVIIDTTVDEDLESERLTRDVVRRLQKMRKDMDLEMEEKVDASIGVNDEKSVEYLQNQEDYIKREVRVRQLEIGDLGEVTEQDYQKKWSIDEQDFELSLGWTE